MCVVFFYYKKHPKYRLILASNRDEFYVRPTLLAQFWEDNPNILAGRDKKADGTWLGVTKNGRFATLTNFRNPALKLPDGASRGELVKNFLNSNKDPKSYLEEVILKSTLYSGFNLIVGDRENLYYYSNQQENIDLLGAGLYGLSNGFLNSNWPKVVKGKEQLLTLAKEQENEEILIERLFALLKDKTKANKKDLPDTGISKSLEKLLSSIFITSPVYGTRTSTVVLVTYENKVSYHERTYSNQGRKFSTQKYYF